MPHPGNKRVLAAKYVKDGKGSMQAGLPFRINTRITSRRMQYINGFKRTISEKIKSGESAAK